MARTPAQPTARGFFNQNIQITAAAGATPPAVDPSFGHLIDYTLTANVTVANPVYPTADAGPYPGEELCFIMRQSGAGSFTATWGSLFVAANVTLTTASATAIDVVTFVWDSGKWNCIAFSKGVHA